MKHVLLIRGLPGSGKTTLAESLTSKGYAHFEADHYFYDENGHYVFNETNLKTAHAKCRVAFEDAINDEFPRIVVSNTFAQLWEMFGYIDYAEDHGYKVEVVCLTASYGSVHDVPEDRIEHMRNMWEEYPGELKY